MNCEENYAMHFIDILGTPMGAKGGRGFVEICKIIYTDTPQH